MAQLKSTKVFGDLNVTGEVNASTKITVNGEEVWDTGNLLNIGTTAATARTALGLGAGATRWPTFAEVTGKPSTYAPSGHTHPVSQITGLGTAATADLGTGSSQAARGDHTHKQYWDIRSRTGYAPSGSLDDFAAGQGGYTQLPDNVNAPATGLDVITKAQYGDIDLLQIALPQRTVEEMYMRTAQGGTWRNWLRFWHDKNFNPATKLDLTAFNARMITAGTGLSGGGSLAANRTLNVSYGTAAGTAAQGNDSRLSDSREWTARTISQAEVEAGTATTRRAFTAQRVRQAIVAWWNSVTGTFGRDLVTSTTNTAARDKLGLHTSATRWPTLAEVTGKPTNYPTNWATVSNKPIVQTTGTSTTNLMSQKAVTDALGSSGQPTMVSNAVLDHTDNSIVSTGITSNLGLEIGDVIEIDNDNLRSGYLSPLGQTVGEFYQFATNGNDVYVVNHNQGFIMKQTNGEGLFEKIEGVPVRNWTGICFIGNQMYVAHRSKHIYSVDEATGTIVTVSPSGHIWQDITTDGTYIYGCRNNTGEIIKVNPITKTEEPLVPTSPYGDVRGLIYSPIDNSLYIGAGSGAEPIRKLVNMTGTWIDVSTEKRPWSSASYYNGKVYFSDHVGQVWKQNDAGNDFELFSKKPVGSPNGEGGNIIVNDILYKAQLGGDIYTTSIIKKDLFTVESIVSADKIIVNYAHALGAGSKSLWNQTLSAAKFKRIAKWYNAPNGFGLHPVLVGTQRAISTAYFNNLNRDLFIHIDSNENSDPSIAIFEIQISKDSLSWIGYARDWTSVDENSQTLEMSVPRNFYYRWVRVAGINIAAQTNFLWYEVR